MYPTANLKYLFSSDTGIHAAKKNFINSVFQVFYFFLRGGHICVLTPYAVLLPDTPRSSSERQKQFFIQLLRVSGNA